MLFEDGYAANAVCASPARPSDDRRYSTRFGFEFTLFMNIGTTIFTWMDELDPPPIPVSSTRPAAAAAAIPGPGMPASEITIAEVLLKPWVYYTAHIGKWHLGYLKGMRPEDQGFDDSLNMAGTLYLPVDDPGDG